mgnify:CR=1 FL=1
MEPPKAALPQTGSTLADRVAATMPSLSDAEKRAARALLARYPTTGMETVALFAERAKVSAPTILRFVAKLGFPGYADFRRALREEMEAQSEFPLTRPHIEASTSALAEFGGADEPSARIEALTPAASNPAAAVTPVRPVTARSRRW